MQVNVAALEARALHTPNLLAAPLALHLLVHRGKVLVLAGSCQDVSAVLLSGPESESAQMHLQTMRQQSSPCPPCLQAVLQLRHLYRLPTQRTRQAPLLDRPCFTEPSLPVYPFADLVEARL